MRLIPGKTKVKIELFRGIMIGDIVVAAVTLALIGLVFLSTLPGSIYIAATILAIGGILLLRIDENPNYMLVLSLLRFVAYPKQYKRKTKDSELITGEETEKMFAVKDLSGLPRKKKSR